MLDSEKKILINETEVKPNKYAMVVIVFLLISVTFCWILNELGIFHVGKIPMRVGTLIPWVISIAPILLYFFKKDLRSNPISKYVMVVLCSVITLIVTSLLNFHATLMLIFPLALAMLYRSKSLGIVATVAAMLCTILSPIFGYLLGVWDIPLLQELIAIGTNGTAEIVGATDALTGLSVGKILLYLALPRLTMVGSFAVLMFYVISVGKKQVDNQILLHKLNERDVLTNLYNQNYYNSVINSSESFTGNIAIIFFDVNNLKSTNDARGHEVGDLLLKRCAKSLYDICDDETYAFRAGGDEFVLIMENADEAKVNKKLLEWKDMLNIVNRENVDDKNDIVCEMAYGYVIGDAKNIADLIHEADTRMYNNKARMKAE